MIDQFLLLVAHLEVSAVATHSETVDSTTIQVRAAVHRLPSGLLAKSRVQINPLVVLGPGNIFPAHHTLVRKRRTQLVSTCATGFEVSDRVRK